MLGLRPASAPHRLLRPWVCSSCRHQRVVRLPEGARRLASNTTPPGDTKRPGGRRTRYLVAGTAVVVAVGLVNLTEQGSFAWRAVQRTGRVISTLVVNISDYRKVLKQKGKLDASEYDRQLKACHQRCADRTLVTMEQNGSVFIKLGQHLTSMNYLLPSEWCDTFIPLQDNCPETSFQAVREMVERDTGKGFGEVFSEFGEEPLGAASLAQVHLAVDRESGQRVAVKVQHPILDYWGPLDLALTKFTFQTLARAFPDYDLTWLSDEMQHSLPQELDFAMEGENAMRTREYFSDRKDMHLVIPKVLWAKRRIIVMEYVTGHRTDDVEFLDKNHISRDEVSATLAHIFNTMIFAPGAPLHCDPHGGNIAIALNGGKPPHNFKVILYDHGLYRTIPLDIQRNYANLWLAVLDGDEDRMRKYSYEVAGITDDQFPLFASAITGRDYRVVKEDISAPRTQDEKEAVSEVLGEDMLPQLVQLLGSVPRIILLILKTNDLTRSLDTSLQTKRGPMRSFLILAQYAAKTVYEEQLEYLRSKGSLFWPPWNVGRAIIAWSSYARIVLKLRLYETYLYARNMVGLENPAPSGMPA